MIIKMLRNVVRREIQVPRYPGFSSGALADEIQRGVFRGPSDVILQAQVAARRGPPCRAPRPGKEESEQNSF